MRKGLIRDVRNVFLASKEMVRCGDPDFWETEDARLDALERELTALLRENGLLTKALNAAVDMHDHCPADDDYPRDYSDKVEAYKVALSKVKPYSGKR